MSNAEESQRGIIQNRPRRQQIADMSGIRFNKITPTDLDAFLDFDNRLFIFIEGKFLATPVMTGQMMAITRLCDACDKRPNMYAFAIIADHNHPATEDIDFANMTVRSIRQNGRWQTPLNRSLSVRESVDRMIAYVENRQGKLLYKREVPADHEAA